MDRSNIEKIARTPEDKLLLAKVWDKINAGIRKNIPSSTCFLTLRELDMTRYLFGDLEGLHSFGGYPEAERQMLIYLPDYLCYGVVFGKTEAEVEAQVADRLTARENAPYTWDALDTWSEPAPYAFQPEEESHYAALIVYMPEEVTNIANYRGAVRPEVKLGITVYAQQAGTPQV